MKNQRGRMKEIEREKNVCVRVIKMFNKMKTIKPIADIFP